MEPESAPIPVPSRPPALSLSPHNMELTDDFSEDPGQLNGMTWVIKLEYQNNDTMTLYDIGGYIRSENDSWLKYEYDYDSPLNTLIWELSK